MNEKVYTVSEVNRIIKQLIEANRSFFNIKISGEISNYKKYPSGHSYFTLKDKDSVLKAVLFKSRANEVTFTPRDGAQVIAIGRIAVYERDGVYQLYVDYLLESGTGNLMLAYDKLKKKLGAEGLFELERKRKVPAWPQSVGIITSESGAAVHDIITVARRRNPGVRLIFLPIRVQGSEAAGDIVNAIRLMNRHKLAEGLIVGRGGGSIEDLWAFNEEPVVRAIANSAIPVVSAVGHETDFTLADFAADIRAATPSQAAEIVVPELYEKLRQIDQLQRRNVLAINKSVEFHANKAKKLASSRVLAEPTSWLADREILVDNYLKRVVAAFNDTVRVCEHRYALLTTRLDANSPLKIMSKGYCLVQKADGSLVKTVNKVSLGEEVEISVSDGSIVACVKSLKRR